MHNNIYSASYQYNPPAYLQSNNEEDLDDHFNTLLGESQSRYTAAQSVTSSSSPSNEQTFHSTRMFVIGTLQSWGMRIGTLPYTRDNQTTLRCILQLITQKQKDIEYKTKSKQQLNSINFQKQKYQSLLKQSKLTISQKQKLLGKLQNQSTQLKKKFKLSQDKFKKQKAQDQKMILMLKSKNDLLLHEIKKKQVQILRIKDQMKRAVVTKTPSKNQSPLHNNNNNYSVKNSFQIIESIQKQQSLTLIKVEKWKKNTNNNNNTQRSTKTISQNVDEQKFNFMMDKYQKEKKLFFNQNSLLRAKMYEIRDVLVKFAQWIQVELFGQSTQSTIKFLQKKFICNHNLMLSKDILVDDLIEVVNSAKNGILQLQQRVVYSQTVGSSKSIQSPTKNKKVGFSNHPSTKTIGSQSNPYFKKKSTSIRQTVSFNVNSSPTNAKSQKNIKNSQKQIKVQSKEKIIVQRSRQTEPIKSKSPQIFRATYQNEEMGLSLMPSQIRKTNKETYFNELQLSAFQNDVLSDIYQNSGSEDPDHSIVSHISTSQLLREIERGRSGKYDKWDILFKSQGDQDQNQ